MACAYLACGRGRWASSAASCSTPPLRRHHPPPAHRRPLLHRAGPPIRHLPRPRFPAASDEGCPQHGDVEREPNLQRMAVDARHKGRNPIRIQHAPARPARVGGCTSKSESSSLTIFRFGIVVQNYTLAIHNPPLGTPQSKKGMIKVGSGLQTKTKKTRVEIFGGKQIFIFRLKKKMQQIKDRNFMELKDGSGFNIYCRCAFNFWAGEDCLLHSSSHFWTRLVHRPLSDWPKGAEKGLFFG